MSTIPYSTILTGVRSGEYIIGTQKSNGKIMKVNDNYGTIIHVKGTIRPYIHGDYEEDIDEISQVLSPFPEFKDKDKPVREAKKWLESNNLPLDTPDFDRYFHAFNIRVKFLNISGFPKLNEEQKNTLLSDNLDSEDGYWPMKDIYEMFPRNPGSYKNTNNKNNKNNKPHTLIFRPTIWALYKPHELISLVNNSLIVNVDNGLIYKGKKIKSDDTDHKMISVNISTEVLSLPKNKLYIYYTCRDNDLDWDVLSDMAIEILYKCNQDHDHDSVRKELDDIKSIIKWMTPGTLKSLLQKIIRTSTLYVEYDGVEYNSKPLLLVTFILLMIHPGTFIPDIQKFVPGFVSATKRLAVTIYEDSYTKYESILTSLFTASLLYDINRNWKPNDNLIYYWMIIAIESIDNNYKMYDYNIRGTPPILDYDDLLKDDPNIYHGINYLLIQELKSFPGDLNMVGSVYDNKGNIINNNIINKIDVIPIEHCIDFHALPEIAYYFPHQYFDNLYEQNNYGKLFIRLFREVTGINPRNLKCMDKLSDNNITKTEFVEYARIAQSRVYNIKKYISNNNKYNNNNNKYINNNITIEHTLSESWIAGIIGSVEIKIGNTTAIVTILPSDIYEVSAIKKLSRDHKKSKNEDAKKFMQRSTLTEKEKKIATNSMWKLLNEGVIIKDPPKSLGWIKNFVIRYENIKDVNENKEDEENNNKDYIIYDTIQKTKMRWSEYIKQIKSYNILNHINNENIYNIENIYKEYGVRENAFILLDKYISELVPLDKIKYDVLQRLMYFWRGYKSYIKLNKINKKGEGSEHPVCIMDTIVNQIFIYLCYLYPAGIRQSNLSHFIIVDAPLMWYVQDHIKDIISNLRNKILSVNTDKWPQPHDKKSLILWEHQQDTIDRMIKKHESNNEKGHLIWIPVRFGKTLIALNYVKYLIETNDMPDYCVYTLPRSALVSVEKHLDQMSMNYQVIDMRKNKKGNKELKPLMVNLIYHDHMRMNGMDLELKRKASNMVFINDEFHMTLGDSIRTSVALEVASLSYDFICLSGTIVRNNNIEQLISWLELNVKFEVTDKNFWTGAASMISKKLVTDITVKRHNIAVDMNKKEKNKYMSLVSSSVGGNNNRATTSQFLEAAKLSWEVCTKQIARYVLAYYEKNEGVFVVAKDNKKQEELKNMLIKSGISNDEIYVISKDSSIDLPYGYKHPYKVVITTPRYSMGYSMSTFAVMITSVYYDNQASREQLEGRLNDLIQPKKEIHILTLHSGILTFTLDKHRAAASLSAAMKQFASEIKK